MSATTQVTTFLDLYTDLQNRLREQTGVTAVENQAKRYINIALQDMHIGFGEKFPWAERSATIRTQPKFTTGTLVATQGSTALTGTGTAWNTNNAFGVANVRTTGRFVINGTPEVYSISAVASDVSLTLNEPWIDEDVTAASYEYFEAEYDLDADFLRPMDLQFFDQNTDIPLIGRNQFRQLYPRNKTAGKPTVATIVDRAFVGNTTPVRRVLFHKPPDQVFLIPYNFVTNKLALSTAGAAQTSLSADTDEPIVPLQFRHAIVFHALYHWYRDRKDDDRSIQARAEYTDIILRISGDQEIGRSRPQFRPFNALYKRSARRPYSRRGSRFTLGSSFDERRS